MLKFTQKTESEQTYQSPHSLAEPMKPTTDRSAMVEESYPQPRLAATTGPSLAGIPLARRNLFGIAWDRLHPRNLRNIRLNRPQQQQRKFLWTRSRKIAAVTLAVTGVVGGRWFYASQAPTVLLPPKTPATLSAPNAQHFYAAASETLSTEAASKVEKSFADILDGKRTAETLAERRAAIKAVEPTLAMMRQGFGYPYRGLQSKWTKEQVSPYKLSSPIPDFVQIRALGRMFAVEASVLASQGNYEAAFSASLDAIRFGQDVGQDPTLIAGMIGRLLQDIGSKEAALYVDKLSASEARQVIPRMAQLVDNEPTMPRILEGERLVMNGAFAEIMQPNASLSSFAGGFATALGGDLSSTVGLVAGHVASVFWYTNQGVVDAYNHYMDRMIQQVSLPYQQAHIPDEERKLSLPPLASEMIPNIRRAFKVLTQTTARNRVLLAQLAVRAYRLEHNGALPMTLADLTHGPSPYLTTVPADPFSMTGTDPVRYSNGKVYSVGVNGKDEGGQADDALMSER